MAKLNAFGSCNPSALRDVSYVACGSRAAVPMTLRQGLGAKVCRRAQSGQDPLKKPAFRALFRPNFKPRHDRPSPIKSA